MRPWFERQSASREQQSYARRLEALGLEPDFLVTAIAKRLVVRTATVAQEGPVALKGGLAIGARQGQVALDLDRAAGRRGNDQLAGSLDRVEHPNLVLPERS